MLNVSNVEQLYYSLMMEPLSVPPKCCIDPELLEGGKGGLPFLQEFGSMEAYLEDHPKARIMFVRSGGLGDVLCLTPILDILLKRYPEVSLTVATETPEVFRYWEEIKAVRTRQIPGVQFDVGFMLDNVLELDYQFKSRYIGRPRLQIYMETLGMEKIVEPVFRFPFSQEDNMFARTVIKRYREDDRVIGVQVAGASPARALPLGSIKTIIDGIARAGHQVAVLHNSPVEINGRHIINLSGKTTLHQLAAVIHMLDLVVTMDSGCMWVAHTTQTPLIAILGPTRARDKTCYHSNCINVETNGWVNCKPCFESLQSCNGGIDCLRKADPNRILGYVLEAIS